MAEGKKSFVAYADWGGVFRALPDDVAGRLIKHIFAYVNDENPNTEDYVINALFEQIKSTLKRDLGKWESQREQRRNAGKASAEARRNKTNDRVTPANETKQNPTTPPKPEKLKLGEFENVRLTEEEYIKAQDKYGELLPAMIEKLSSYIKTKGNKYKDHYATFGSWVYDSVIEKQQRNGNSQNQTNGNHAPGPKGAADGVQRTGGKQSYHVTASAVFDEVQNRQVDTPV